MALIDFDDLDLVADFRWCPLYPGPTQVYAVTYAAVRQPSRMTYLHRKILGVGPEQRVDHRNSDGLDCRRLNLRLATSSQNNANRRKVRYQTSSRFKGVYFRSHSRCDLRRPWVARLRDQILGSFASEEDAALAYDRAAVRAYGEFARLNFPTEAHLSALGEAS